MYPDLERTMRSVDLQQQISPNAIIPRYEEHHWSWNTMRYTYSRTTLPLELRRQWSFWPDYTIINPASTAICVDGEIGTVLKTYREVLNISKQQIIAYNNMHCRSYRSGKVLLRIGLKVCGHKYRKLWTDGWQNWMMAQVGCYYCILTLAQVQLTWLKEQSRVPSQILMTVLCMEWIPSLVHFICVL